ncbi:MAG: hypothetical protein IT376_00835 [Polyangiaceae bacterium]|nr:hypothetical protein [Polyangiaceae bacterium]
MPKPLVAACLVASAAVACGGAGPAGARGSGWDVPVPASEPREELAIRVTLPPGADCEERFDLALYEHRGVDLVTWDEAEGCRGRTARIRFLPRRITRAALLERARQLAAPGGMEPLP